MTPTQRAADIVDLENLLDNAGSFEELSDQAIVITRRLLNEAAGVRLLRSPTQRRAAKRGLREQADDLEHVLRKILKRRHANALEKYADYLKGIGLRRV